MAYFKFLVFSSYLFWATSALSNPIVSSKEDASLAIKKDFLNTVPKNSTQMYHVNPNSLVGLQPNREFNWDQSFQKQFQLPQNPLYSLQGGSSDGGGDSIICKLPDDNIRVYFADFFWEREDLSAFDKAVKDPRRIVLAVAKILDELHPEETYTHPWTSSQKVSLGWLFLHRYNTLNFSYVKELPELDDDFIDDESLPENCEKVQIGIQDLRSGNIHVKLDLLQQMSFLDQGFFEVHETFINMRNLPRADTTAIRKEVEELYKALDDPSLSIKNLLNLLITPMNSEPFRPWSHSEKFVFNQCRGYLIKREVRPHDSKETRECIKATQQYLKEVRARDLQESYPTLIQFPGSLICKTYYTHKNSQKSSFAQKFKVSRLSGSGAPIYASANKDSYQLTGISPSDSDLTSTKTFLTTHRKSESMTNPGKGTFQFSINFFEDERYDFTVFLRNYFSMTNEFTGSIQRSQKNSRKLEDSEWAKIVCSGEIPQFDMDLENSF